MMNDNKVKISTSLMLAIMLIFGTTMGSPMFSDRAYAAEVQDIVINEVAWMGTSNSTDDEWIELYNQTGTSISLDGWMLSSTDGTPGISLSGTIPAKGFYLLERTDDTTVPDVAANLIYTGAMSNAGEYLQLKDAAGALIDSLDAWHAGDNTSKAAMERTDAAASGTASTNWTTATLAYNGGYGTPKARNSLAPPDRKIAINEMAWMGTTVNYNDEWIELFNNTDTDINLSGWTLNATDGTPSIMLNGTIPAKGYYLLERTDDTTVSQVSADMIYSGAMSNTGEILEIRDGQGVLIDSVNAWYAGNNDTKATMERIDSDHAGTLSSNWNTATASYQEGYGTPKAINSGSGTEGDATDGGSGGGAAGGETGNICNDTEEHLNQVSQAAGAINVYFNKCAFTGYASSGNAANYNVNFENRLIERLNSATVSIDFATYEINLPGVVNALMNRAAAGVTVRLIADAKDASDPYYTERYETMRLYIEKMIRGLDGQVGTADDIVVLSDSPMFAVEDSAKRSSHSLPSTPEGFSYQTLTVGSSSQSGYVIAEAEQKSNGSYYSPNDQMHNKFALIDDKWVFTGTWNFTVTGLYGSDENMQNGILGGNQNHVVEIHSPELAAIYETEFNEMWGSAATAPDLQIANFHSRKTDNTAHVVNVGGRTVEVYFSPGDNAVGRMVNLVKNEAESRVFFSIFAWSDQALVDELKYKWEGSYNDLEGTLTGFDIKGVFDSDFWNQWWSASVDMTGRTASTSSANNPNTRWANPAPVYKDNETRKLHSKTMLIDPDTGSDPTVVVGSTNWSNNGNNINDENMLIIHDEMITNQFVQEFYARYQDSGGTVQ